MVERIDAEHSANIQSTAISALHNELIEDDPAQAHSQIDM